VSGKVVKRLPIKNNGSAIFAEIYGAYSLSLHRRLKAMSKNSKKPSLRQSLPATTLDEIIQDIDFSVPFGALPDASPEGSEGAGKANGQALISCPFQIVNYGLDTLHISYDVELQNPELLKKLKKVKDSIQRSDEVERTFEILDNGANHFKWNLQRTGSKLYPFVLRTGDLILCMSTRKVGSKIPNMALHVGSLSCAQDLRSTLNTFKFWLSCVGVEIAKESVSRVDICSDIIHDIKKGRLEKVTQYITQARDTHLFYSHRKFTGIQWGSGDIVARIYDKQLQMKQQQQIEKMKFFNHLWETEETTPVTRVEFQIRRKALTEMIGDKDTTVDDVISRMGDIWVYCTTKWIRHSSKYVDVKNNNQKQAPISFFWESIQNAYEYQTKKISRNRKQKHINIPALRRQAIGVLTSVLAGLGVKADCFFEVVDTLQEIVASDLSDYMALPDFAHKYNARLTRSVVSF
jgi:hypothetical protein